MCRFKSLLVGKDGRVYISDTDSHDSLFSYFGLKDAEDDNGDALYARVEITPPKGNPFADLDEWKLKVDDRIIPSWFSPGHEGACRAAFADWMGDYRVHYRGPLDLRGYNHPLDSLKSVGGPLDLRGYNHPLDSLKSVGGPLDLRGYNHPLGSLESVGGPLDLRGYNHPLDSLKSVGGYLYLDGYNHPLDSLESVGGYLDLDGYNHPLGSLKK